MSLSKTVLAAASIWALAGAANAACELKSINVPSDGVVIRYDPFDQDETRVEVPIRLRADDCRDARFELAISPLVNSQGPGQTLRASDGSRTIDVRLLSQGGEARVVNNPINAFNSPAPAGRVTGAGTVSGQPLRVALTYGQVVAPGRYRAEATLFARVIDGDGRAGQPVETRFYVDVDVQPSFRLAAGVDRRLFLGELAEGVQSDPVNFNAFSNIGYDLSVRSYHDWRMTLNGSLRDEAPGVPYEVTLSGQTVSRSSSDAVVRFATPPQDGVRNHRLRAKALAFSPQPAGTYRDWITIEIKPRA
ncbi:hypothetical protein ACIQC9_14050 [Brevundimonas sp. NPDC092305]|uniref:hypothetical protein n=1 Tax=Brevundimonas sp. NPDC092305 TaxID=3363957 RepID=UPI00380FB7BE